MQSGAAKRKAVRSPGERAKQRGEGADGWIWGEEEEEKEEECTLLVPPVPSLCLTAERSQQLERCCKGGGR